MKHTLYITAIAAGALMLCGCQRESLSDAFGIQSDAIVKFVPSVTNGAGKQVKGELYNESGSDKSLGAYVDSFMVVAWSSTPKRIIPDAYALGEDEDHGFAAAGCISGDETNGYYQKVKKRTGAGGTEYWMTVQPQIEAFKATMPYADDEYIWKKGETKKFYAYANLPPSGASVANTDATGQTLTYTVPATAAAQKDILLGFYSGDGKTGPEESKTMTGTASIRFYHPLTAVRFVKGTMNEGLTIQSISLSGLAKSATATMNNAGVISWGDATGYDLTASSDWTDTDANSIMDEAFLLIPQDVATNHVTVTVTFTNSTSVSATIPAASPSGKWDAGKVNTYTLNYDANACKLTVNVTAWNEEAALELAMEEEPDYALNAIFSVSPTKKVKFARGNLRYTVSSQTWSLFDQQYQCGTSTYASGHANEISLFTWGYNATKSIIPDGKATDNVSIASGELVQSEDWGCQIGDGATWRTLSRDEWKYLLDNHTKKWITVCGVGGYAIAPDNFTGSIANSYADEASWKVAEDAGVIFLPAAGYREGSTLTIVGAGGCYWSSSAKDGTDAYRLGFNDSAFEYDTKNGGRNMGCSVRLVKDYVEPEKPELLTGKFSVSPTEYVQFSRGNVQAVLGESKSVTKWRFAYNQYDYLGTTAASGNTTMASGYIVDLFGWSGVGKSVAWGISASTSWGDYSAGFEKLNDWGKNFGDGETWETMTRIEWLYIFNRSNTNLKGFPVTVCGIANCLVIAPDDFTGTISSSYDANAWTEAEKQGLVCLPPAGSRVNGSVESGTYGYYWTSTPGNVDSKGYYATTHNASADADSRAFGRSVRLVQKFDKPIQYVKIGDLYWATENLAITASGKREYKTTGHVIGDYFQWAASYNGYNITADADKKPDNLLVYTSFTNTAYGDGSSAFSLKTDKSFRKDNAPYYSSSSYSEYTSGSGNLESGDDVATIILGGTWRIPTSDEFDEMYKATTWTWNSTDQGYYVTEQGVTLAGNKSNALLFFPAAGYGTSSSFSNATTCGIYWSSSLRSDNTDNAYRLYFDNGGNVYSQSYGDRHEGYSIRPVMTAPTE